MPIVSCVSQECEAEVAAKKRGMCKAHYNAWYYQNVTKRDAAAKSALKSVTVPGFTCVQCGTKHHPSKAMRRRKQAVRKFCNPKCNSDFKAASVAAERLASRLSTPRHCLTCGEDIRGRDVRAKFCGAFCCDVRNGTILTGPRAELICGLPECSTVFVRMKKGHRCCCENHGKILSNRERRADGRDASSTAWDDRRKAHYQKRRAQKKMVPAESVSPQKVYDRDCWVCGVCDLPVDRDCIWPDPMSPSLDHIHPLSKGGHHTYENTQLAHLVCNIRKNDTVIEG